MESLAAAGLRSVGLGLGALACLATAGTSQHSSPPPANAPSATARHAATHDPAPHSQASPAQARRSRPDANGTMRRSTHDPRPSLPPLLAWQFLERNNRLYAEHGARRAASATAPHSDEHGSAHGRRGRDDRGPPPHEAGHPKRPPSMLPRPAGAGRYVCAIVTCADVATDLPAAFGLATRDVLMLKIPGPFVNAETAAMLERAIVRHRLSLVLVLGHSQCEALSASPGAASDALDRRVAALQRRHRAASPSERNLDLTALLARRQRELLLASSERMQRLAREDHLRIVPGHIHARTGRITWQHRRAEALPLAPVR